MSLANKYRPMNFEDVVEQQHIVDILKAHISKGSSHTNYLFYGPRGTGKTTCARILAKALNCENPVNGNPCNTCDSCKVINDGRSLDIVEIDAASHTGVDNIRGEIIDKAGYPPVQLKMKVYIIDEVHMLSKGAFNALLKIMEEPGETIRFILATTEIHKVLDTIISRCQVFNFKRITNKAIITRLQEIAKNEKLRTSEEANNIIAQMSEWCMRDAIKYLDQVSILWDITEENVTQFLGIASANTISDFLNKLIAAKSSNSYNETFDYVQDIYSQGVDLHQFTKQVLAYIDINLTNDITTMSELANTFSDIMLQSKRYPQPLLLYKTKIYEYINGNPTAVTTAQAIPTSSQTKTPAPEIADKPYTTSAPGEPIDKSNLDALTKAFIAALDKPSVKGMFDDQCKIQWIKENIVDMVVINPMAKLQVSKKEALEYLEWILSDVIGSPHILNFIFKSKEEFMQDQLFGDL